MEISHWGKQWKDYNVGREQLLEESQQELKRQKKIVSEQEIEISRLKNTEVSGRNLNFHDM